MAELPLDKDWAWVVDFGVFWTLFWSVGVYRVYGMIFIEVSTYFNASSTTTSLMFAIYTLANIALAPIYSLTANRLSPRTLCIIGGISSSMSLMLQQLSTDVYVFSITFGIFSGLGILIVQFSSVVALGTYFEKRVTLASGLGYMGVSVGQLTLPLVFDYLLQEYGFRGALLIFGACNLNTCAAAMLFRPASFYLKKSANLPGDVRSATNRRSVSRVLNQAFSNGTDQNESERKISLLDVPSAPSPDSAPSIKPEHTQQGQNVLKPGCSASGMAVDQHDKIVMLSARESIRTLCKSPSFHMFSIGRFCLVLMFMFISMYYPPYAAALGYSTKEVAQLLTIVGVVDLPSRPLHGWITSFTSIDPTIYSGICVLVGSVIVIFGVLVPSFISVLAIGLSNGVLISAVSSLQVAIAVDCVGKKLLASALPVLQLPVSIASLFLPTLFGVLYDASGSYNVPMLILGTCGCIGGIITIAEKKHRKKLIMV